MAAQTADLGRSRHPASGRCQSEIRLRELEFNRRQLRNTDRLVEQLIKGLTQPPADETGINWQRDVAVLSSIPEVGRVVRTTLLAEGSDLLQRRDFPALRSLYGTPRRS